MTNFFLDNIGTLSRVIGCIIEKVLIPFDWRFWADVVEAGQVVV